MIIESQWSQCHLVAMYLPSTKAKTTQNLRHRASSTSNSLRSDTMYGIKYKTIEKIDENKYMFNKVDTLYENSMVDTFICF